MRRRTERGGWARRSRDRQVTASSPRVALNPLPRTETVAVPASSKATLNSKTSNRRRHTGTLHRPATLTVELIAASRTIQTRYNCFLL